MKASRVARLKDTDSVGAAFILRAVGWSLFGAVVGAVAGIYFATERGFPVLLGLLGGVTIFAGASVAIGLGVGLLAGRYARSVLQPSGSTTPSPREYSHAASLAVRGMFDAALRAYADAAAEHTDDPTPWLRGARLLECELMRYEDAADWYRNARDRARAVPGTELLTTRALAELYLRRLAGSRKAAPELQRLLTRFPDTPAATWAREELDAMRAAMLRELHGDP